MIILYPLQLVAKNEQQPFWFISNTQNPEGNLKIVVLFCCDVMRNEAKEREESNTTRPVFTDLSRLTTCYYSLMFNRPIKVFMERGAFAARGPALL